MDKRWLVPVTTVATLVANGLANALPIAGRSTGEISDMFPVLVTPAGYVFSIWGVIYLGLVGYSVWQSLPAQAANPRVQALVLPVALANVANLVWILLWHYLWIGTSLLAMLVLLASLIVVYLRLRAPMGRRSGVPLTLGERVWARGTFSVYLGWITVATVANTSIVLYDAGWDGGFVPAQVWAAITLLVATVLGGRMLQRYHDGGYALVLVWAFVGIVLAQWGATVVVGTAIVGTLALLFVAVDRARASRGPAVS
jgi:translocator protein